MSELMERYEREKTEKLNPKSDLTKEYIVYVVCWILFIGSLLSMAYIKNGLDINSFNDFIKLMVMVTVMLASFRVINKECNLMQ